MPSRYISEFLQFSRWSDWFQFRSASRKRGAWRGLISSRVGPPQLDVRPRCERSKTERAWRFWSVKKIYVGNLSWSITEGELQEFFGRFGEVQSVAIVTDRESGRSRGFGFVEMDGDAADRAISEADGQELAGRQLRVNEAQDRQGGGGGGRGGR
ncbi:MAG: RNA-binding protein [Deltaproteobacteria bacterium]|nr:RNA-binding protein [Deltaproteobacteria bacterium]